MDEVSVGGAREGVVPSGGPDAKLNGTGTGREVLWHPHPVLVASIVLLLRHLSGFDFSVNIRFSV